MPIKYYFDNGATTQIDPKAFEKMNLFFTEKYGNASSTHSSGWEAKDALESARSIIAKSINARESEIIFTSGGTESNNFAMKGIAFANREKGNHIITTKVEHKSILNTCKWLEKQGFKITYLNVDNEGFVRPKDLENAINEKTILFSVIHGNNEVGTIQNLEELGKICHGKNIYFHTDACQSYTKTEIDVKKQNLDLISLNSHKIHGPKGVGMLFIKEGTKIENWQHGGSQEFSKRAGTENIHGIVGFAEAVKIGNDKKHIEKMERLRNILIAKTLTIDGTRLNGPEGDSRLCNNINISFKGIEGEALGGYLDQKNICSSTGSACSAKTLEPSYVLKAIGLNNEEANGSIRLTISRFTTEEEINYLLKTLNETVQKLRKISPFWKVVKHVLKRDA
jgi:cysteine desulfurase